MWTIFIGIPIVTVIFSIEYTLAVIIIIGTFIKSIAMDTYFGVITISILTMEALSGVQILMEILVKHFLSFQKKNVD